jgi:hypothetical protein
MAPVLEVADIFRRHGEAFRQAHAGHLGCVERRIVGAITACRTAALGGHVEQCDDVVRPALPTTPALWANGDVVALSRRSPPIRLTITKHA